MGFQEISKLACIHGRFQPFHLGHANYLQECIKLWPNVLVGLAAPTPVKNTAPGVEHRATAIANPLTYTERVILIRAALNDLDVPQTNIEFLPFPIDEPESIKYILPQSVLCVTTKLYEWNEEKIRRLNKAGYNTFVLEECIKFDFNGSLIRQYIIENNSAWKDMVLPSVAQLLQSWQFRDRLLSLQKESK
ncbi:MAG: adenylyltransferase/cytidyltransferase family protein [Nitrosomonas sp.]|uniref:adenylyltransferase/cytidyltransferase family protein n=1 Tax=Nitrosomonas sp. TaxID=42353 RepID=UPI002747417E|nr:adenylyltransferase/cytidyltransferase family protein [Nitrosomonas sp.]MDP3608647.1 adenylyltransferase/cytidyltransferase family protein [Methylophilus sp.]MDZ4107773.1 adenylyltransferase/cytidyltransferase family protein [Nitrosomonas sp.]